MAEASHINAKKAVRGLAADLQDFHDQGQHSSASHLMQQGSKMAEVLLDIATNASIRGMRVDGVDLFSVLDESTGHRLSATEAAALDALEQVLAQSPQPATLSAPETTVVQRSELPPH
jgi:hypothetical protein